MAKNGFLKRHGIVRNKIAKDILYFAIPFFSGFFIEMWFCARDGLVGFWGNIWGLVKQPRSLSMFSVQTILGLALFMIGFVLLLTGQITLFRNYSSTLIIREDHQLVTHGIYRYIRHPMYLGLILVIIGLPVYSVSLSGFLTSIVLIPIVFIRIRLEEILLTEEYQDGYQKYKETTKKLIPFIY